MNRPLVLAGAVSVAVVVADQITKAVAVSRWERQPVDLGLLRLTVHRNPGGAFNLLPDLWWLFVGAVVVVTVMAGRALLGGTVPAMGIAIGLLLGGAWGNVIDRLLRYPGFPNGRVVDFVDFKVWPVFNLADSAIVIGVGLLILVSWSHERRTRPRSA